MSEDEHVEGHDYWQEEVGFPYRTWCALCGMMKISVNDALACPRCDFADLNHVPGFITLVDQAHRVRNPRDTIPLAISEGDCWPSVERMYGGEV